MTMPLDGVRVIDLTSVLSGPLCTMMLGDAGADVIKVASPKGDQARTWGPPFWGALCAVKGYAHDSRVAANCQIMNNLLTSIRDAE